MSNPYISPFAKPVYVMLKPVGSVCNLACEYCYYLEKGKLYQGISGMSDDAAGSLYLARW